MVTSVSTHTHAWLFLLYSECKIVVKKLWAWICLSLSGWFCITNSFIAMKWKRRCCYVKFWPKTCSTTLRSKIFGENMFYKCYMVHLVKLFHAVAICNVWQIWQKFWYASSGNDYPMKMELILAYCHYSVSTVNSGKMQLKRNAHDSIFLSCFWKVFMC